MSYTHLQIAYASSYAVITLDYADKSANVLSQAMIGEIDHALAVCEQTDGLTGFVIRSGKKSGFVFGADIIEFESLTSQQDVQALQKNAMALLDRLERSPLVTIADVHGPALGGGMELALACDWRMASHGAKLMVGFPEANLGLMPGYAGTARAARLIGGAPTLELCLSAKPITKLEKAQQMGVIDALYDDDTKEDVLETLLAKGKRHFTDFCDGGAWDDVIKQARDQYLGGKKQAHYPHLYAICDHFEGAGPDYQALIASELHHFPILMMSDVSANLRRVFALTDQVKKQGKGACDISFVQVIGAGAMGADIATYLCLKGCDVVLSDINADALAGATDKAFAYFDRKLSETAASDAKSRFATHLPEEAYHDVQLVIEAVPEKLSLKQNIWAEIAKTHSPHCLFATNSSALDLDQIASKMPDPARLMGLHFFNPATVMPLIEVITRDENDADGIASLMAFSGKIGKLPVAVRNSPGFLVNRALLPYIFEAVACYLEGTLPAEIDDALLAFGMPMGPLELADQIGLDICFDVGERLGVDDKVASYLTSQMTAGHLGRKTGEGIYRWDGKRPIRDQSTLTSDQEQALIERMLTPLWRECQNALDEGHIASADLVDAAMIFGTGFPRHTGGPLHYLAHHKSSKG